MMLELSEVVFEIIDQIRISKLRLLSDNQISLHRPDRNSEVYYMYCYFEF